MDIFAFAAIYIIWGSTYLAIRIGVETYPPLLLTATRFLVAGIFILGLSRFRREARLTKRELKIGAASGILLIAANGFVCVIEQTVPSSLVAIVVGSIPICILLLSWLGFGGKRPTLPKAGGSLLGLLGVGLIATQSVATSETEATLGGFSLLGVSCLFWSLGTLLQKDLKGMRSPFRFSALQMLSGSLSILCLALLRGEQKGFSLDQVSTHSFLALVYLIFFGSIVAFSAYNYLSRTVESYLVSTYALVNPVIAVALGVLIYGEPVGWRFLGASALILTGLSLMLFPARSTSKAAPVKPVASTPR